MLRNNQQQCWRSMVQPPAVWCTALELARSPVLTCSNIFHFLLQLAFKPRNFHDIISSNIFLMIFQTSHWVYTFLMAGTLCLCLFSSHALNWCINMMTNLASNRKSTGKWKIDNWQCWEFILQGGKEKIKPDTQIPAGAYRQRQGGSALPSRSSKPEI